MEAWLVLQTEKRCACVLMRLVFNYHNPLQSTLSLLLFSFPMLSQVFRIQKKMKNEKAVNEFLEILHMPHWPSLLNSADACLVSRLFQLSCCRKSKQTIVRIVNVCETLRTSQNCASYSVTITSIAVSSGLTNLLAYPGFLFAAGVWSQLFIF